MLRYIIPCLFALMIWACGNTKHKPVSAELIGNTPTQTSIFNDLITLTGKSVPESLLNDSLAFLILPVKLSCPACRKKTIDSIVKHRDDLFERHFIIISGSAGRRNISSYFQEVNKEMPVMENQLFLDTTNLAYKMKLVTENPVIYYTANQKAFKKVSAIPATVRDDLREFFSGIRNIDLIKK